MATVETTVQQVIENTKPDNIRRIEDYYGIDLSSYHQYVAFNENGGVAAYKGFTPNYGEMSFYENNTCEVLDLENNYSLPSQFLGDSSNISGNCPTAKVVKNALTKGNYRPSSSYSDGFYTHSGEVLGVSNLPNLTSFYFDGLQRNTVDARWSYHGKEHPFILKFSGLSLDEVTVLADKNSKKIVAIDCSGTPIKKLNISEDATLELVEVKMKGTKITEWNFDLSSVTRGEYMFQNCGNLTSFSGDLSSLTIGEYMFQNTNLTSFDRDLPSLTTGSYMFNNCSNLTSFDTDLSSLTTGSGMFQNTNLTSFDRDLPSLSDGSYMFQNTKLETWDTPIPNLKSCYYMFQNCNNLKRITLDMSSATGTIHSMFSGCKRIEEANITGLYNDIGLHQSRLTIDGTKQFLENLETTSKNTSNYSMTLGVSLDAFCDAELRAKYGWTTNNKKFKVTAPTGKTWEITLVQQAVGNFKSDALSDLVNGSNFCSYDEDLISWDGSLSSLTNGSSMFFGCSNLTSFSGDLSSLTNGSSMFIECSNLTSFSGDLSSLTRGYNMFNNCSNLTSFDRDLSSLTVGEYMFQNCGNLTSFSGDLSSLTTGYNMFYNCSKLTSFSGDLFSLTRGDYMFYNTNLDAPSVERILTTIKEITHSSSIHIGIKSSAIDKVREITGLTGTISRDGYNQIGYYKGWNLYIKATSND